MHDDTTNTPLRRAVASLLSPFQQFAKSESTAGILLFGASIAAFAWANSPWSASYQQLLHAHAGFRLGGFAMDKHLGHWVNDGLMAVFFLLVGLEIKRELIVGELSNLRRASLAVFAAVGGMLVPALIFWLINRGGAGVAGWGIPMATDIAFALGVVQLLGKRVPVSLKVLLTAVAIVDDLGAVVVIALFYTASLDLTSLALAGACLVLLIAFNRFGVRRLALYIVIGLPLWYFTLKSGIHATIAGVLLAWTIPLGREMSADELASKLKEQIQDGFEALEVQVELLEEALEKFQSPLHRLEHALHPFIAYLIMPIFALFNAGVALDGGMNVGDPVTLGVMAGLFLGKPIGILLFSYVAIKAGLAALPEDLRLKNLVALGCLAGIGFTMSLFVAGLAYPASNLMLSQAKVGILLVSVVSAIVGSAVIWGTSTTRAH
ncbi:MAG: Na+/H+ antiporter NhaA [Myxococcales bacterium]|nr:Na+/H+ antiporter NhaA [Myxococcales bacterium]